MSAQNCRYCLVFWGEFHFFSKSRHNNRGRNFDLYGLLLLICLISQILPLMSGRSFMEVQDEITSRLSSAALCCKQRRLYSVLET